MAVIQPEIVELRERVAKLEERQKKLNARLTEAERATMWWRLFTATALLIVIAIFIATWI